VLPEVDPLLILDGPASDRGRVTRFWADGHRPTEYWPWEEPIYQPYISIASFL